ncbi:MAG: hypothetical protein V1875_02735 [Candidatus Altiarchaeota archaeon]
MKNVKKPVKLEHRVNWYFGNRCARCGRINLEAKNTAVDAGTGCMGSVLARRR